MRGKAVVVDNLTTSLGLAIHEPGAERVSIDSLLPADSPRVAGENAEHAQALAESEATLPPIVVQRTTMRVIDGMHRLRAAKLRGQSDISVRFYEGDDEGAFIVAVEANIAHGLPLSVADRTAAAARILAMRPQWSDRRIASVTGLAPTTVGAIRRRSAEGTGQLNVMGQDGKVHPLSTVEARLRASDLIKRRPEAPIREIAEAAGISPATALDVRHRLRDGEHPVPAGQLARQRVKDGQSGDRAASQACQVPILDWERELHDLTRDPSLRFTDAGRALLRWLHNHTAGLDQWKQYIDNVPAHSAQAIAMLAQRNSIAWQEVVQYLQRPPVDG